MDFSHNVFRTPASSPTVSEDTMSHANLVMACQWGWSKTLEPDGTGAQTNNPITVTQPASTSYLNNIRSKRFAPCQGRLYHQLLCSHRVRTDFVEDCGANCVEPFGQVVTTAFVCNECIQAEVIHIWEERKAAHNALYPSLDHMSKEQYDQWYHEHRQLEAEYVRDRRLYEIELKASSRPSNICTALEASKEETEFAAELDSLSLSLMASNEGSVDAQIYQQARHRVSLPNDASEQLHWDLNTLALDRGSCGVEYTASRPPTRSPASRRMTEEEVWGTPRA
ncbi:hypothetical protein EK21DRAFT_78949 [Setomelanomma holmii]|uniref:Uncharacterized protein n=1 Tax=Setomelanomma holmii TaxID=210430 RepID=A0A9P4GZ36_9PLEO|nr:hypothetical protein EK21DRAFT_78949 [Setomelanomma holmii]